MGPRILTRHLVLIPRLENHRPNKRTPHTQRLKRRKYPYSFYLFRYKWQPSVLSRIPCSSSEHFSNKREREREFAFSISFCFCFCFCFLFLLLSVKMLGVFSGSIVSPPEELVAAGCRTPSPKITSGALVKRFVETNASTVSVQAGDHVQLAYTHHNQSPLLPR